MAARKSAPTRKAKSQTVDAVLASIAGGDAKPVYLVTGDLVLAEPASSKLATALAEAAGVEVTQVRRPGTLGEVLQDLRTYSLFDSGKVLQVIESALLADRSAAADLIDDAIEVLPIVEDSELGARESAAVGRLLQALRLFSIQIGLSPGQAILQLPEWALQGGQSFRKKRKGRGRTKKQVKEAQEGLVPLLEAGLGAGLQGWAESDASDLAAVLSEGLPPGHHLVLCESSAALDHPLVASVAEAAAFVDLGKIEVDRKGQFGGLDKIAEELSKETGVSIDRDALEELAKRTLRKTSERGNAGKIDAESTARLAGEYRKLANLAGGGKIDRSQVVGSVDDRGEEDVWKLLDAVGDGRAAEALTRLRRMIFSASDPMAARLSFFALISEHCRHLTNVQAQARLLGVPLGERNYNRFKNEHAPRLQGSLPDGLENPLGSLHPFRLYRAYSAVSRLGKTDLSVLPSRVLETEMRIKGESGDADVALAQLVAAVAMGGRRSRASAGRR